MVIETKQNYLKKEKKHTGYTEIEAPKNERELININGYQLQIINKR